MIFKGAPGCNFKGSKFSTDLKRHLDKKTWCPCKAAQWTIEKAKEGQIDQRTARYTHQKDPDESQPEIEEVKQEPLRKMYPITQLCSEAGTTSAKFMTSKKTRQFILKLCATDGLEEQEVYQGPWVCEQLLNRLYEWLDERRAYADSEGQVYAVTSPLVNCVKIGMWHGSWKKLLGRYLTYYGEALELVYSPVSGDARIAEKKLHREFSHYHVQNELYDKRCWTEIVDAIWCMRQQYCQET